MIEVDEHERGHRALVDPLVPVFARWADVLDELGDRAAGDAEDAPHTGAVATLGHAIVRDVDDGAAGILTADAQRGLDRARVRREDHALDRGALAGRGTL